MIPKFLELVADFEFVEKVAKKFTWRKLEGLALKPFYPVWQLKKYSNSI